MARALVFDFDGLILDTERPAFEGWRSVFAEHGFELSVRDWAECIGTPHAWNPLDRLEALAGPVDRDAVHQRGKAVHDALLEGEVPLPGVLELLAAGRELGLPMGIASSSPASWVEGHVDRLGLREWFDAVVCHREGVLGKPAPDLYLEAVSLLGVAPGEAIAFEDSENGVRAAKAAGLWCVAVPHALTAGLDLSAADLVVDSLASVSLVSLLDQFGGPARSDGA
jgi:HAD superfamily hydrolase (TIGR01509 family)